VQPLKSRGRLQRIGFIKVMGIEWGSIRAGVEIAGGLERNIDTFETSKHIHLNLRAYKKERHEKSPKRKTCKKYKQGEGKQFARPKIGLLAMPPSLFEISIIHLARALNHLFYMKRCLQRFEQDHKNTQHKSHYKNNSKKRSKEGQISGGTKVFCVVVFDLILSSPILVGVGSSRTPKY